MDVTIDAGYPGQTSLLAQTNKNWTNPQTCKDYLHDALAHYFYSELSKAKGVVNITTNGEPIIDNPGFIYWCAKENTKKNSIKFCELINQLEDKMGFESNEKTRTYHSTTGKTGGIIAVVSPWWFKNPVAVSAYLTFIRLSITMRVGEKFDDFINRMIEISKQKSKVNNPKIYPIQRDAGYIAKAVDRGNLEGLITRSLPCFYRDDYSDYILSLHGRGFSGYDKEIDTEKPKTEKELMDTYQTILERYRTNRKKTYEVYAGV